MNQINRVGRMVRRHGFRGSVRLVASRLGRLAYLQEAHVWYRLHLRSERQAVAVPVGLNLIRAGEAHLSLLDQLPGISLRIARRRLAEGADLWIAREADRPVFACWIFRQRTPVLAAPGGWLDLPSGTVGVDDWVMSPTHGDREALSAAWSALAAELATEPIDAIVMKVAEANLQCRGAIRRVGFRAVASMRLERIGGRIR